MFTINMTCCAARACLVAACVAPVGIQAQQEQAGNRLLAASGEPPQVIVSASRFEEAYDAGRPIGVSVVTADEIRRSGVTTIYEALGRLGGVFTRNSLGGIDDQVDLRGFGITGDQNTLVLIDGQRISENELQSARLSGVPLNAIERIEIVRGSGAVLYGGGATGGVINIITSTPLIRKPFANLAAIAGSYGTSDYRIDAGLGAGPLMLDVAGNRYSTDGFRRNSAADQSNLSARARLVGADGEISFRVASERQHVRLPGALTVAQAASDPRDTTKPNDYGDTDANHYSVAGKLRFGWGELAIDAFRRDKVNRALFVSAAGGFFRRSGGSTDGLNPRVLVSAPLFGQENRLVAGIETGRWSYLSQSTFMFGGSASEDDLGNANFNAFNSANTEARQSTQAWYVKDEVRLGNLRLSLGARREKMRQAMSEAFNGPRDLQADLRLHAEEIGIAWALGPHWTLFGKSGNSFRVANVDENAFLPALLQPQTSRDTDVGVSYQDRVIGVDLRAFEHRLQNEIMCTPIFPGFCSNVNLPPTVRSGVEVTAKWRPAPMLSLSGFVTHMRARFRSAIPGGPDLTGKEVPLVPRVRATLQADLRLTPRDSLNAGLQHVGSQVYDNDQINTFGSRLPGYTTVNLKYTHRIANMELSVAATNLGNRGYSSYGVISGAGVANIYPERRRALFAGLTIRY